MEEGLTTTEALWGTALLISVVVGLTLILVVWSLNRAAKLPSPTLTISALVMLIVLLLMGYIITDQGRSSSLLVILGVLTGSLVSIASHSYGHKKSLNRHQDDTGRGGSLGE